MKSSYAMALLLMGWYLMAPAEPRSLYDEIAPVPPLSKWQQLDSFDTAQECKQTLQQRVAQWLRQGRNGPDREYEMEQVTCVASDDPRLAK
jgi:hypothetical protein